MDITPLIPKGRQIITGYGDGGFKINQEQVTGSIVVFPDHTQRWDGTLTPASLQSIFTADPAIELLLIGTGAQMAPLPADIRDALKSARIAVEVMDTGAACRTYNVVMSEERRVAAALVAV